MKIPDTKQDRRRFIKEHLFQYQDKSFYCRALDCDVKVTAKSRKANEENEIYRDRESAR